MTPTEVYAEVVGLSVPQGSMRALKSKAGFPYMTHANPALKAWRAAVTAAVKEAAGTVKLSGAVLAYLVFVLPRPKSVDRPRPCVRPDVDKLARACLDAVSDAGVWDDDSQVTELHAIKVYAREDETPKLKLYLKEVIA